MDRGLRERAPELRRARERIAQLRAGDRLFISAEVADYLDLLHGLGASRRMVRTERDAWLLLYSVSPAAADAVLAEKRHDLDDPEFRAIYLETTRRSTGHPTTSAS